MTFKAFTGTALLIVILLVAGSQSLMGQISDAANRMAGTPKPAKTPDWRTHDKPAKWRSKEAKANYVVITGSKVAAGEMPSDVTPTVTLNGTTQDLTTENLEGVPATAAAETSGRTSQGTTRLSTELGSSSTTTTASASGTGTSGAAVSGAAGTGTASTATSPAGTSTSTVPSPATP